MAQVRTAGCAGTGDLKFGAVLASCFDGQNVAGDFGGARDRGCRRAAASALVSRLSPPLDAAGFCHQPVPRTRGVDFILHFHPHAGRLDFAAGGKRCLATQAAARGGDLLAASQRLQSARPAFLKREFETGALAQPKTAHLSAVLRSLSQGLSLGDGGWVLPFQPVLVTGWIVFPSLHFLISE